MAGGYANIKPKDGKQFSKEYQPKEKWTEKKALALGNELILWMNEIHPNGEDKGNIFYEDFLVIERGLYPELITYLSNKFTSVFKLLERAKKIQEIKLIKYGVWDKLNASMTKFVLTNHHGYKDKTDITSGDEQVNFPILLHDPLNDKVDNSS